MHIIYFQPSLVHTKLYCLVTEAKWKSMKNTENKQLRATHEETTMLAILHNPIVNDFNVFKPHNNNNNNNNMLL